MTIFNKIANWLKALKTPKWLVEMYQYILDKIRFPVLQKLGKEAINDLQKYIIEASHHDEWSGVEKLKYVRDKFIPEWKVKLNLTDSLINMAIELVLQEMKSKGFIK